MIVERRTDELQPGNIMQIQNLTGATIDMVAGMQATPGMGWAIVTKVERVAPGIFVPIYAISIQDSSMRIMSNGDKVHVVSQKPARLVKIGHFSRWVT